MTQQRLCLTCNAPFDVPATSKRQFCSVACHPKQTHSREKKPPVVIECARCGREQERPEWEVKRKRKLGWAFYCSVACRDAVKRGRKGKERVERIELACENCGKQFKVAPWEARQGRRFCSKRCAVRHNSGRPSQASRTINGRGYVFVFVPSDERPPGQEHTARHPEHRVVMREVLGRWPEPHETVHHINGNRADNRPENLQLRSGHHGHGAALRCRSCGSSDIESVEL